MNILSLFLLQTSANRKQVENMAKKKLDSLMKESKIRDREDPDSFTIAALPPAGKAPHKSSSKVKTSQPHTPTITHEKITWSLFNISKTNEQKNHKWQ